MSGITIKLKQPISAHGEQLTELVMREPTSADVMELGMPFLVHVGEGEGAALEIRPKVVGQYIVRLAGIPLSSVKQLAIADLQKAQAEIQGFFGQSEDEPSSSSLNSSSTSLTSGA